MKILFLSRWFPYPPSNGSKLRIYNLLYGLAQKHEVTLLSFVEQSEKFDAKIVESICQKVQTVTRKPFNPNSLQARLGFFSLKPRSVINTFSPEMKQCIEQTLASDHYDVVIASQFDMAVYSHYFNHIPAIFEEVEVGVLYESSVQAISPWHSFRNGLTWAKHRKYLNSLLKKFQVCTVVSNQEHQLLSQTGNGSPPIEIIPNCVDVTSYKDFRGIPQPNSLIFTGSFNYYPNYEAMYWFLDKVYPYIQTQVPDVSLTITGDPANCSLPPHNNVTQTGFVDDVRPFIANAWGSVVPIHMGGGTRLKILEAMALGTPVVATSKGAEGLDIQPDKHILIADTPEDFAQQVIRLLKDQDLRQHITNNAYNLVSERYNWPVVLPQFLELIDQAVKS